MKALSGTLNKTLRVYRTSSPEWNTFIWHMDRVKRIWYLSPMRAAKVQASLRIRAVSPEPPLLARTSSEPRGTFRQKARSLAPLNDLACAVKICHDGMLEDTNSLDGAHIVLFKLISSGPCLNPMKIKDFLTYFKLEINSLWHQTASHSNYFVITKSYSWGASCAFFEFLTVKPKTTIIRIICLWKIVADQY